jgi:hypothetical protein
LNLFNDKGKPVESPGRKAKGPENDSGGKREWQPATEGGVFMKKLLTASIIIAVFLTNMLTAAAAGSDAATSYNTDRLSSGIIALAYDAQADSKLKVMVEKDGKKVTYNLRNDGLTENFPLQFGDGEYKVSILENVVDNQYKYVSTENIKLDLPDDKRLYLESVQNINWNKDMTAIKKANELTKGLKTDSQKIKAIYDYVVNNFSYDFDKLTKLSSDYLPDIDKTVASKKGICYDYASTFAAMLRSQGIPAKLVKGYSTLVTGYHAWNEVYENGKWIVVDTTYDAQMKKAKTKYTMGKKAGQYTKVYEY